MKQGSLLSILASISLLFGAALAAENSPCSQGPNGLFTCPSGFNCVAIADNGGIQARKCVAPIVCTGDMYGSCPTYSGENGQLQTGICTFVESRSCNDGVACATVNGKKGLYKCVTMSLCDSITGGACSSSCKDSNGDTCGGNGICNLRDPSSPSCQCNSGSSGPTCTGNSTTSPSPTPSSSSPSPSTTPGSSPSPSTGDPTSSPSESPSSTLPSSTGPTSTSNPDSQTNNNNSNGGTGTSLNSNSGGLSGGGIAGIVIAAVVVVGLIAMFIIFRNNQKRESQNEAAGAVMDDEDDIEGVMTPRHNIALM